MLVGKDRYEFKQEMKEGEFSFVFRKIKNTRSKKERNERTAKKGKKRMY